MSGPALQPGPEDRLARALVWQNPWHFLAFGFGSGTARLAPGTWGTLAGMPFVLLWQGLPSWLLCLLLLLATVFGCWLCGKVARDLGVHDHEGIVWDEIVGIWITLCLVPGEWYWWLFGFALFRLLDIFKPWPISWIDRHLHGGMGIMLDDVVAGLLACALLQIAVGFV